MKSCENCAHDGYGQNVPTVCVTCMGWSNHVPKDERRASDTQIGGNHYAKMKIQPFEYIQANGIGFAEGSVIKYVSRWRSKNGIEDLKKARHFIDLLIEKESADAQE